MKEHNEYIIDEQYSGRCIKDFLINKLGVSHRNLVNLKKNSAILLNDEAAYVNARLTMGDRVEIFLMDKGSENILPEAFALDIIYEDDYLIVVNKEAGMPVHPTKGHFTGTVANALAYYWRDKGKNIKIRPINRLDKDTSGLVLFAKNSHVQYMMSKEKFSFRKEYIAVVEGLMEKEVGIIDLPIKREGSHTIRRTVSQDGQRAVTSYKSIKKKEAATLLRVNLVTGRTHQIRVHMSSSGHPLFGDELYGGSREMIQRQALHAEKIFFIHPATGSDIELHAKIPRDIKLLCDVLGF
ncbi:RluA family pseudouridine synthase [Lutispora saccharofermentans]|uniref:Pseudouridine synthase n=1 Tax=Lutispora saccharofermentans TaxID=3024236 RepID=A0ABT1NA89_9FIRM|nr:RluA family pseudouridine synthase [Lutispora saccharofermentans]MCQ1528164.1 RluA family pseudouridine synthase [Lutispora saccharofermentans]